MVCCVGVFLAAGGALLLGLCKDDACLEETQPILRWVFAAMIVLGFAMCAMEKAFDASLNAAWSCLTWPCRRCVEKVCG